MLVIQENARVQRWEKATENWMLGLSLLFVAILIFPLAHPLSPSWKTNFHRVDIIIWILFGIDYVAKLASSNDRRLFFKGHYFELLIVAIPFFRPLRLLRLFPLVAYFLKYSKKGLSGRLLQYISLAAALVIAPAAILMYQIERLAPNSNIKTLLDAFWWASATITTVGYGDKYPTTNTGRLLALLVMLVGISLIGVITASVASWFVKADVDQSEQVQLKQVLERLESIEKKLAQSTRPIQTDTSYT